MWYLDCAGAHRLSRASAQSAASWPLRLCVFLKRAPSTRARARRGWGAAPLSHVGETHIEILLQKQQQARQLIDELRERTLEAVEAIVEWRQKVAALDDVQNVDTNANFTDELLESLA